MWCLRRERDREAIAYLQRAIPLVLELHQPLLCGLRGRLGCAALFTGDAGAAREAFRYELALSRDLVAVSFAPEALLGLAAVAAANDDLDRAARLTGAAAAHRRSSAPDDALLARLRVTFLEPARRRCGSDAWDAALETGEALSLDDAIAFAFAEPAGSTTAESPRVPVAELR
jgi:hypothetical protein